MQDFPTDTTVVRRQPKVGAIEGTTASSWDPLRVAQRDRYPAPSIPRGPWDLGQHQGCATTGATYPIALAMRSALKSRAAKTDKNRGFFSHSDVDTIGDTLATVEFAVDSQPSSRRDVNEELRAALLDLSEGRRDAVERVWDLIADDLYGLALWRTGSAADAEDAVQDVFLRLSSMPGKLGSVHNPRAYLLRMAHNAAVDAARRRESPMPEIVPTLVAIEDVDAKIDGRRASDLLLELPVAQREVVFLRHFAGFSFREIGEVCQIPTFTAASRHRLAIRRLQELLGVES